MTIQEYFGDWAKVINLKEADSILRRLNHDNSVICPRIKDIFKAFHLCPLQSLRVVILGQDPYPTLLSISQNSILTKTPVATGIAFANSSDTLPSEYSSSLKVLRESVIDYSVPHESINFDPSLEKWEAQGVLMLNSALSCVAGKIGSHTLLWRPFIKSLLIKLSMCHTGIVYVLMGTMAQSFDECICRKSNYVIHIRHPSWYARTKQKMPSEIWKEINSILIGLNGYGIEWYQENNNH